MGLSSDHADDRRTVVLVGSSSALFVRPLAWGIVGIAVRIAFFPCILVHLIGFDLWIRKPILWRFARKPNPFPLLEPPLGYDGGA